MAHATFMSSLTADASAMRLSCCDAGMTGRSTERQSERRGSDTSSPRASSRPAAVSAAMAACAVSGGSAATPLVWWPRAPNDQRRPVHLPSSAKDVTTTARDIPRISRAVSESRSMCTNRTGRWAGESSAPDGMICATTPMIESMSPTSSDEGDFPSRTDGGDGRSRSRDRTSRARAARPWRAAARPRGCQHFEARSTDESRGRPSARDAATMAASRRLMHSLHDCEAGRVGRREHPCSRSRTPRRARRDVGHWTPGRCHRCAACRAARSRRRRSPPSPSARAAAAPCARRRAPTRART